MSHHSIFFPLLHMILNIIPTLPPTPPKEKKLVLCMKEKERNISVAFKRVQKCPKRHTVLPLISMFQECIFVFAHSQLLFGYCELCFHKKEKYQTTHYQRDYFSESSIWLNLCVAETWDHCSWQLQLTIQIKVDQNVGLFYFDCWRDWMLIY